MYTQDREVKAMLDLVKNLSYDINAKFLEPACGDGNFLIEILKRKMQSLDKENGAQYKKDLLITVSSIYAVDILQDNINESISRLYNHIEKDYIDTFKDDIDDDILLSVKEILNNNIICGDTLTMLKSNGEPIVFDMKFDVIIGNPPYQMNLGLEGGNKTLSKAIYHQFVEMAQKLEPKYITMIIPSRWMTKTAQGIPKAWVDNQIQSNKYKVIHDYENARDCFPTVDIGGGVNYFLWDRDYNGKCNYSYHRKNGEIISRYNYLDDKEAGTVIRDPFDYDVISKIEEVEGTYYNEENNMSCIISPKSFFNNSNTLTSNWRGYELEESEENSVKYYVSSQHKTPYGYIKLSDIPKNAEIRFKHKVLITAGYGGRSDPNVLGKPFYSEPNSVCSQTFLIIGYNKDYTKEECENIISYIKTKFFRYLVSIKKKTLSGPRGVYQFVPMQDFSKPWTDEELYEKYGLSQEEINYIEENIKPRK